MTLKTDDVAAVKELIEKQANTWNRYCYLGSLETMRKSEEFGVYTFDGRIPYYEISVDDDDSAEKAHQEYIESLQPLIAMLHVRAFDGDYEYQTGDERECNRIAMLTSYIGFPFEWQLEAYRTYLSEELPNMLNKFVAHQKRLLKGEYRAYIFEDYLFNESGRFKEWWSDFVIWAKQAQDAPTKWAQRVRETDIIESILNYPEPQVYPAPKWSNWHDKPHDINYAEDSRYIEFQAAIQWQTDIKRAIEKAKGRKKPSYRETPIETYYTLNLSRFQDMVTWIQQCIDDGKGLYFWG